MLLFVFLVGGTNLFLIFVALSINDKLRRIEWYLEKIGKSTERIPPSSLDSRLVK